MEFFLDQDNKFVRSLIENAKKGNNASFEQLFRLNCGRVYTVALRLLADPRLAASLTVKVFVEAWQQIGFKRGDFSFSQWVTGIAVYNSLSFLREGKYTPPDSDFNLRDFAPLEKAVISLPEKDRLPFVLHDVLKYTISEVSDMLFLPPQTAKEHLISARNSVMKAVMLL